jgi:hypothetical protein
MSRRGVNLFLPLFVALVLAMPAVARDAGAKNGKSTSATLDISVPVSLAGKQLKPGTYNITADDARVTLAQNGKVVAEAPVQWKDEPSKARYSKIVTVSAQLKEIHFGGKMRYIEIAD